MQRNVGNLSLVAGSMACDAPCPFCVARMTPSQGMEKKAGPISKRNLRIAIGLARELNAVTALITSKGEPLLAPQHIDTYLEELSSFGTSCLPIRELQTNGKRLISSKFRDKYAKHLSRWYGKGGLSTIALSLVSHKQEHNSEIYTNKGTHYDLAEMISYLHGFGYSVRLSMVMLKGKLDTIERVEELIRFAQQHEVDQLTLRPVAKPEESGDVDAMRYVQEYGLDPESDVRVIEEHLRNKGAELEVLPHGAVVLDIDGQNVCLTNCLTVQPSEDSLRQLIFFPNGRLSYDWQYSGAVLLGPDHTLKEEPNLVAISS